MAVRATPMRRLDHPPSAAPTAKTAQPAAATGPMMAPARSSPPTSSASRIGWKVSKTIIATDQKSSTVTMPRSTALSRSRPRPSRTTLG